MPNTGPPIATLEALLLALVTDPARDLAALPTFGGPEPIDRSWPVFSWDPERLLVAGDTGAFRIVPRPRIDPALREQLLRGRKRSRGPVTDGAARTALADVGVVLAWCDEGIIDEARRVLAGER